MFPLSSARARMLAREREVWWKLSTQHRRKRKVERERAKKKKKKSNKEIFLSFSLFIFMLLFACWPGASLVLTIVVSMFSLVLMMMIIVYWYTKERKLIGLRIGLRMSCMSHGWASGDWQKPNKDLALFSSLSLFVSIQSDNRTFRDTFRVVSRVSRSILSDK